MTEIYFMWEEELNEEDPKCAAIAKFYEGQDVYYEADIQVVYASLEKGDVLKTVKGDVIPSKPSQSYTKIEIERAE